MVRSFFDYILFFTDQPGQYSSLANTLVNDQDIPKEETKEGMFRYLNESKLYDGYRQVVAVIYQRYLSILKGQMF